MVSRVYTGRSESVRFFNGEENERIPGKREEEHFDKDDRKLEIPSAVWLPNGRHRRQSLQRKE